MGRGADEMVVIVGAGISFDAPTRAPGFGQIRNRFLKRCGFAKLVREEEDRGKLRPWLDVDHLSPEQIFNALDDEREETRRQIRRDLWWLCETRGPNQNHRALAKLIASGARVWTPNFDTMIERAAAKGQRIDVVHEPTQATGGTNALIKPHGSFPRTFGKPSEEPRPHDYDLLFRSSEVWHLDPAWRARLEVDCTERDVHLFGYRGADPDLTPAILAALTRSRSATWWECDEGNLARLAGFVDLAHVQLKEGNPSTALRKLAEERADFTEEEASASESPTDDPDYKLRYQPTLASRASLAGALSAANTARWLRLRALLFEKDPDRRRLMIALLRSAGFDWAAAREPIALGFSRGMRRSSASDNDRERMAILYITLVDARPLRRSDEEAIDRVRSLGLDPSPQIAVRFASILKLHGDLASAREIAEQALAGAGNEPLLEGMIRYNLAWIYRQQADFEMRRRLIEEMRDLYPHVGPNWSAWIALDNALLALQRGDAEAARQQADGPFMNFVSGSIGHPAYLQDAKTATALIDWHESGPDAALKHLKEEHRDRPVSRILPPRYSSITTLLLIADNARARGDARTAHRCLCRAQSRAVSSLQQAQINLARAFLDRDPESLRAIEASAQSKGFGLVAKTADATIALLDGQRGSGEILVDDSLPLPALY